jgi:hypothetical protein
VNVSNNKHNTAILTNSSKCFISFYISSTVGTTMDLTSTPNRLVLGDSILKNVRHIKDCAVYSLSGINLEELTRMVRQNPDLCKNYKTILIHCGTNNIQKDSKETIVLKFKLLIDEIRIINPSVNLLISDILARPIDHTSHGQRVIETNCLLRGKIPLWNCHLVASHKISFRNCKPVPELFLDGLHLNQNGTMKLKQFLSQRLSEYGTKPISHRCSSLYLRRHQWSNDMDRYIKINRLH